MSTRQKSNNLRKTRSSIKFCEEKLDCRVENATADYFCSNCNTFQCKQCTKSLHKDETKASHDRAPVPLPQQHELCQNGCNDRNYADVTCEICKKNFCFACFKQLHSTNSTKKHKTKTFTPTDLLSSPEEQCINPRCDDEKNILDDPYFSLSSPEPFELPDIANVMKENMNLVSYDASSAPKNTFSLEDDIVDFQDSIKSFMLIDNNEKLLVKNMEEFCKKLGCEEDNQFKVVSIFGNTGDGKSYTLNHAFCGGREVFETSSNPDSCTIGVWAAYDPLNGALLIDTEGLLGISENSNQRTRLLLKVLAISDVIIYRTRAERLHTDLFKFLADASSAYEKHFSDELKALQRRCSLEDMEISNLGPAVIIFHETHDTDVIGKTSGQMASNTSSSIIKKRFAKLDLRVDAFRAIDYVGTRTITSPTEFKFLRHAVITRLKDDSVRSKRRPAVILQALKTLNEKFSGKIEKLLPSSFPDEYFTCTAKCFSCNSRCTQTVNHSNIPHSCDQRCIYQSQFDNKMFYCKHCYDCGDNRLVVPKTSGSQDSSWVGLAKFAWSGYVLECTKCGVIYRSRQFWYGNEDPDKSAVRTVVQHVWPGGNRILGSSHNAAQKLLDGLSYVSEGIANLSAKPAKAVSNLVNDQIAPAYWIPNSKIKSCSNCGVFFGGRESIHHCRACGKGFCDECSSYRRAVPERGWGQEPVRVCKDCSSPDSKKLGTFNQDEKQSFGATDHHYVLSAASTVDPRDVRARKLGEAISSTLGVVASAIEYPKDVVKDSARPSYWTPDADCKDCKICNNIFNLKNPIHHCRSCGEGICENCSKDRLAVPERGWDSPVRVCTICASSIANSDCDGL